MTDVQDQIEALRKEVRLLRDRQEIRDCVSSYCRGLDRLDPEALRSAYHADALDRHGPFRGGREEFVSWAIDLESKCERTHHSITNHLCEVSGDVAHAETYVIWFALIPDGKRIISGAARYVDQLARRNGKWAISARCEVMDLSWEQTRIDGGVWEEVKPARDRSDLAYQRPLVVPEGNEQGFGS